MQVVEVRSLGCGAAARRYHAVKQGRLGKLAAGGGSGNGDGDGNPNLTAELALQPVLPS